MNQTHMSAPREQVQFSGRALPCDARRERTMRYSAGGVLALPYHGPLHLLVMRHAHYRYRASDMEFAISTTTATLAGSVEGRSIGYIYQQITSSLRSTLTLQLDVNISVATSYFANGLANFTGGNPQYVCSLTAQRIR